MSKLRMNKSIATLALVACVALPTLAAEPVVKEKGSRAKELLEMKENARQVKPIAVHGIEGPVFPTAPASAPRVQPASAPTR
jgi:hypothetical protein